MDTFPAVAEVKWKDRCITSGQLLSHHIYSTHVGLLNIEWVILRHSTCTIQQFEYSIHLYRLQMCGHMHQCSARCTVYRGTLHVRVLKQTELSGGDIILAIHQSNPATTPQSPVASKEQIAKGSHPFWLWLLWVWNKLVVTGQSSIHHVSIYSVVNIG